jgi:hypothetical protein
MVMRYQHSYAGSFLLQLSSADTKISLTEKVMVLCGHADLVYRMLLRCPHC